MKKLNMFIAMALTFGLVGFGALASEGKDDMDMHHDNEAFREASAEIMEIKMEAAEEAAEIKEEMNMAKAEGDFEEVAELKGELVELSAETAEEVAEEIGEAHEDFFDDKD